MCLLVAAFDRHAAYRLVLVGHRDEFHARPAVPLGWWDGPAVLLAGRDLQAGGTWLGVDRHGRVGVVTNFRAPGALQSGGPSRGELVPASGPILPGAQGDIPVSTCCCSTIPASST
jgi:uncharacterized protein with NRDE domain